MTTFCHTTSVRLSLDPVVWFSLLHSNAPFGFALKGSNGSSNLEIRPQITLLELQAVAWYTLYTSCRLSAPKELSQLINITHDLCSCGQTGKAGAHLPTGTTRSCISLSFIGHGCESEVGFCFFIYWENSDSIFSVECREVKDEWWEQRNLSCRQDDTY